MIGTRMRWWLAAASASALLSSSAAAGDLYGQIRGPDGRPAAGARVVLDDVLRGQVTDAGGRFRIPDLPGGSYKVTVSAFGMATDRRQVDVPETGQATLAVTLQPNPELARLAARYKPPAPQHGPQKDAFLATIGAAAARPDRPNVVVILFDDLGYGDLSAYGNRLIRTPNIDALGRRGVTLEQFYSTSPVCTPSRAALLTGRYPTRSHAANHVFFPSSSPVATLRRSLGYANALPQDEILIPEILSRAGYATGAFGKWHLGDTPGHLPTDFGFQSYFGVLYSNDMSPLPIYRGTAIETPAAQVSQATLTERFTDEAVQFIRANSDRPFFAYLPYTAPHVPHAPNPARTNVSAGGDYGDVVEDLDAQVGRITAALDELGLSDNTLIILTSDNGADYEGSAGALRGRKGETFEGGMRVPGMVVWPGHVRPGSRTSEMAMQIDILPTILSAVGLPAPQDRVIDGRNLLPMLAEGAASPHEHLFYVTTWTGEYEAVRERRFKYRDRTQKLAASPWFPATSVFAGFAEPSLYDLERDNEAHDLSKRYPEEAARLAKVLQAFRAEMAANPRGWR